MNKSRGNPNRWDWYGCAGILLTGFFLIPTPWSRGGIVLIGAGIGVLAGLLLRRHIYRCLPDEDRKRVDREAYDERNLKLRERASWLCWQGETLWCAAALFVLTYVLEVDLRIVFGVIFLWAARLLIFEAVHEWLRRKY